MLGFVGGKKMSKGYKTGDRVIYDSSFGNFASERGCF